MPPASASYLVLCGAGDGTQDYVSILQTELHPHPLLKDISFLCCQLSPGVKLHSYPQAGHSPSATCLVLQDKKVLKVGD